MINGRHKQVQKQIDNLPVYSINELAIQIARDWKNISPAAMPYLKAMLVLDKITDNFYNDSAKEIVLYFLSNAQTWRGEEARRIKTILNKLVK